MKLNQTEQHHHRIFSLIYPIFLIDPDRKNASFEDWLNNHFPRIEEYLPKNLTNHISLYEQVLLSCIGLSKSKNIDTPHIAYQNSLPLQNIFQVILNQSGSLYFNPSLLHLNILNEITTIKTEQPFATIPQLISELKNLFSSLPPEPHSSLPSSSLPSLADNILFLIQKYTSFTSSFLPQQFAQGVSFFNHVKTASGIYNSFINSDNDNILLLGGDISGIQSYIYDILNKKAARNLKGRSFYLQFVSDSIVSFILQQTNNFQANILYSSGGGFYLFLPSNKDIKNKLQNKIIPTIQNNLFQYHKTSFFIAIDFIEFNPLNNPTLSTLWQQLTEKISTQKRAPFLKNINQNYSEFFEPKENQLIDDFSAEPIDENNCFVLNEEKNTFLQYNQTSYNPDTDLLLSAANMTVIKLAEELLSAKYILKFDKPNQNTINICDFTHIQFAQSLETLNKNNLPTEIYIINPDFNTLPALHYFNNIKYIIYFYGGNDYPKGPNQQNIKDFSELTDKNQGFNRLAVLRMDVDNLGSIFASGLPSFAHYSSLSYFLDMFFKYYLNFMWNSNPEYKTHTFIIYSGGDDLFLIGDWTAIINFACNIHQSFSTWTGNTLTLSAGISIIRNKFPILKSALLAEEEENNAKQHKYQNTEKNAISFMNFPLSFNTELPLVTNLKKQIKQHLQNNNISKSLIYKIYFYSEMYKQKHEQNNTIKKHQWKWLMAYDFSRNKNNKNEDLLDSILSNSIQNNNQNSKYHYIELLAFAARWAELENR